MSAELKTNKQANKKPQPKPQCKLNAKSLQLIYEMCPEMEEHIFQQKL